MSASSGQTVSIDLNDILRQAGELGVGLFGEHTSPLGTEEKT